MHEARSSAIEGPDGERKCPTVGQADLADCKRPHQEETLSGLVVDAVSNNHVDEPDGGGEANGEKAFGHGNGRRGHSCANGGEEAPATLLLSDAEEAQ